MNRTWVLVAESSRARIFSTTGPRAGLDEIRGLTQPEVRLKERDLVSDSPGRSFDSGGAGRHAMGRESDQKRHETEMFAKTIAGELERARERGDFDKLILIAPPAFLGLLRKSMHHCCAERVVATVNKNLVQHDAADIRDHLPEWF
ncbi:MAG: host attachment protein [Gammaproteobacteria bacterium]|nr:host attachment protein [Gammaproteobacteria bacterium]NNF60862.1 host attachment protein [Gammaproteobacteria bacterium]NNM21749.1 host attachment protein [Gammaproteobacteria bacterium]